MGPSVGTLGEFNRMVDRIVKRVEDALNLEESCSIQLSSHDVNESGVAAAVRKLNREEQYDSSYRFTADTDGRGRTTSYTIIYTP